MDKEYRKIVDHYENCFKIYGDTHKGVDWPSLGDLHTRFKVMLELIQDPQKNTSLLDFGCGTALLLDYLHANETYTNIQYTGLDIGDSFIEHCKIKYPAHTFLKVDVLEANEVLPEFDYIVMNGVFTEKRELGFEEMWAYSKLLLSKVFEKAKIGISFNVMSKAVDWEREDLFHLSTDLLIDFLSKELSRHFIIRNDYGLYEYTTYVFKKSQL